MVKWFRSGSCWSHVPVRLAGTLTLALLCSLAGVCTHAQPARASCICPGQITYDGVIATSSDTVGDFTLLPDAAGEPHAFLSVTPVGSSDGYPIPIDTHQVGVWYNTSAGEWGVFNEDGSAMPLGVEFNVYAQQNEDPTAFFWTAPAENTSGSLTFINNAELDGNPSAELVVTQNWSPNFVYNPHPIGVWYDQAVGEWTIYNEDGSPLPNGASFNIRSVYPSIGGKVEVATSANTTGATFCMSDVTGVLYVFVTHVYSGYITDVAAPRYHAATGDWCLVDAAGNAIPIGTKFFIF